MDMKMKPVTAKEKLASKKKPISKPAIPKKPKSPNGAKAKLAKKGY